MAKITQVGPGRKTTGTIDGITYVTRNGVTYARSAPTMPATAYNTPAAKKRQAIFKMVQGGGWRVEGGVRRDTINLLNAKSYEKYYFIDCTLFGC